MTQVRVGWRAYVSPSGGGTGTDTDAQAFITATGITDSTQISALNTLVNDLKTYGLWTKMKAIYPFVGGSAASHKFNLKDPRDLDVAFRLVFSGGWVHSSNGAKPNGTNGYANTYLVPNSVFNVTDLAAAGYYSRTATVNVTRDYVLGAYSVGKGSLSMVIKRSNDNFYTQANADFPSGTTYRQLELSPNPYTADGLYHFSQQGSTFKYWRNTTLIGQNVVVSSNLQQSTHPIFLGTYNNNGTPATDWTDKETAFSYFSTKLTDTEATNLYTTIQKFQTTLGRHVGTPYVSDPDAIAFLMAAGITDSTQAAAINTLVIRMKADGVWTKMKAIYPFVGGSATSHKWNLKDPRDADDAFRLVFNGGWTHTSNGAKGNGTTGYADTKLIPSSNYPTSYDMAFGFYSRTDVIENSNDISAYNTTSQCIGIDTRWSDGKIYGYIYRDAVPYNIVVPNSSSAGLISLTRTSTTMMKIFRDTSILGTTTTLMSGTVPTTSIKISGSSAGSYSTREKSFIYIGNGLSDAEINSLYSAVQSFQTTLGRQVNVPLVSDTDAQAFLNAANITSFQQASAVNKLVVDLKAAGVWTKMKAIYPFVGGSAASHKWNLKDPRDLDAAYRLVFNGGWTHTVTGALPNGSNAFADTKLKPTDMAQNSVHMSTYLRTQLDNGVDMGVSTNYYFFISANFGVGILPRGPLNLSTYQNQSPNLPTQAFYIATRTNSTTNKLFRNTSLVSNETFASSPRDTDNIYLGAGNRNNSIWQPSARQQAFASIGDGLSDAESSALYTAVETYQTSLGRGVNTPIYNNGLVLNLDAGNANSYPGTGTTWLDLAAGNNGTLTNGPTYDTANGGSIVFDGVNDYVGLGNTPIFGTSSFTIDMWIYLPISDYNYRAILSKRSNSNYTGFAVYRPPYSNSVAIQLASNSSGPYFTTSISSTANSWNHISIVVDRTLKTVILYSNGIKNTSTLDITNLGDMTNNGVNLNIGLEAGITNWNNKISTTKIYSRALSETEVLNNFNSTRGRFGL